MDGHSNIRCLDALLSFDNYPDIQALGGEDNTNPEIFHVCLTNPPFGALLTGEVMQILGRFALGTGRDSLPLEILGLERTLQFLRPGGRIGYRASTKYTHKYMDEVRQRLHFG